MSRIASSGSDQDGASQSVCSKDRATVEKLVDSLQLVLQMKSASMPPTGPGSRDPSRVTEVGDAPTRDGASNRSSTPERIVCKSRASLGSRPVADHLSASEDLPHPPHARSWDWPLSRHEKKARVSLVEQHLVRIDRDVLVKKLTELRSSKGDLSESPSEWDSSEESCSLEPNKLNV